MMSLNSDTTSYIRVTSNVFPVDQGASGDDTACWLAQVSPFVWGWTKLKVSRKSKANMTICFMEYSRLLTLNQTFQNKVCFPHWTAIKCNKVTQPQGGTAAHQRPWGWESNRIHGRIILPGCTKRQIHLPSSSTPKTLLLPPVYPQSITATWWTHRQISSYYSMVHIQSILFLWAEKQPEWPFQDAFTLAGGGPHLVVGHLQQVQHDFVSPHVL